MYVCMHIIICYICIPISLFRFWRLAEDHSAYKYKHVNANVLCMYVCMCICMYGGL